MVSGFPGPPPLGHSSASIVVSPSLLPPALRAPSAAPVPSSSALSSIAPFPYTSRPSAAPGSSSLWALLHLRVSRTFLLPFCCGLRFSGPTSYWPFFGVHRRLAQSSSTCATRTIGGPEPVTPLCPLFVGIVFLCPFSPLLRWDLASHLASSLFSPL